MLIRKPHDAHEARPRDPPLRGGDDWNYQWGGSESVLSDGGIRRDPTTTPLTGKYPESIRAEKFELVDKTGTRRAVLALEPNGEPALKLYDATGSLRVALSLRPDGGPHLLLWDGRTAVPRFGLALLPNGSPSAELADRNGVLRVVFGLGTNGEPALGLFDQKGNLHPALGSATGEKPTR